MISRFLPELCGAITGFVIFLIFTSFPVKAQPIGPPFGIYETKGACVYYWSAQGAGASITAISKKDLMQLGEFKGC